MTLPNKQLTSEILDPTPPVVVISKDTIIDLGMTDTTLYAALVVSGINGLTWEQTLMLMVSQLAREKKKLTMLAEEAVATSRPDADAPGTQTGDRVVQSESRRQRERRGV